MENKYEEIVKRLEGYYSDNYQMLKIEGRLSEYKPPVRPLGEVHFKKIEAQLGYALPNDYCELMRDYAGFAFDYVSFLLPSEEDGEFSGFSDSHDEYTVADDYHAAIKNHLPHSYGSGDDRDLMPGLNLVRHVAAPVKETFWPEELLPIGYDMACNSICLALFGLRPGAIFYCKGFEIHLAANSFDEFMHLLELRK